MMVKADAVEKTGFGSIPSYEAVFAITGLLTVDYIMRTSRTKKIKKR